MVYLKASFVTLPIKYMSVFTVQSIVYLKMKTFLFKDLSFFMSFCLHICLCTMDVSVTCRGQKRVSGPLKVELQMVVSHCLGAGN